LLLVDIMPKTVPYLVIKNTTIQSKFCFMMIMIITSQKFQLYISKQLMYYTDWMMNKRQSGSTSCCV